MCGFAGVLSTAGFSRDELGDHIDRMTGPIAHRGPDDKGTWIDEHAGVAFGFRRLAIIDVSPLGHQPMTSPSGRYVIVFNGEIYNFKELRRELEGSGFRFRGGSDTEVMLAAFDHWGVREGLRHLVGMFASAVWDVHRRELLLVRDRLGKKPLYVYREPGLITFGSELKALVAGPSFDRTIDRTALASYLRYLYVPAPRSIFERAVKVPPAHLLAVSDPRLPLPKAEPYWSLREVAADGLLHPFDGSPADAIDALDSQLADAVSRRMCADVPLGALLSGGIDSSTVVAFMQEASSRPVKTYTIGFSEEEFDEARHAARVAQHLGTDHTELMLTGDDACALVPRMPDIFDEPLADPSQLPTLLVSQLARREVTVALCGDGGDELFGGYNRYVYGTRVLSRLERVPPGIRRRVGAGIGRVSSTTWDRMHRFTAAVLPHVPAEHFGERVLKLGHVMNAESVGDMYRSLLSAWQHPADVVSEEPIGFDQNETILNGCEPADLLDRMMLADQLVYLPDDLLAKVDRASMAVSLEVRAPLLDHRVVEFSWRLPRALKLRDGVGKWILRQVLYRRVPQTLVERPKMGFSVPIDRWLRGPLKQWASELLAPDQLARTGLLNPSAIVEGWRGLQLGRPAGAALWAVIMFQAWRERWQA
ncbi:MAG TPA: asparagine synthase (glutamine-hydrolyzing) [Vicinamibacterales bacterium]|nr:asparagine synthase (glutamine-hydrolyzing) [Vicinamibacterales bacterium]